MVINSGVNKNVCFKLWKLCACMLYRPPIRLFPLLITFKQEAQQLPQMYRATRCVSRNLVNPSTAVAISCTTNPQQMDVKELERYGRPTCIKQSAPSNDASTVIGVIHKLDRRRTLLTIMTKFSKSWIWDKVPKESSLIFGGNRFPFNTV